MIVIIVVWHLWARLVRSSSFAYLGFFVIFTCFLRVSIGLHLLVGFALVFMFSDCFSSFLSLHVVSLGCFCVPFCGLST